MKLHATERMRVAVNDAMDVHGGKAVIDGPHNYLGALYRAVPIGITVEGANILTRNLIVFGQGAIRAIPICWRRCSALADREHGLDTFDRTFWKHVGHSFKTHVPRLGPELDRRPARARAGCRQGEADSTGSCRATPRPSRSRPIWRC